MLKLAQITSETKLPVARRYGRGGMFPEWRVVGEVECAPLKNLKGMGLDGAERDDVATKTYLCLQCPHCPGQVRVLKGDSFHKTKNTIVRDHLTYECLTWRDIVPAPIKRPPKKRSGSDTDSSAKTTLLTAWKLPSSSLSREAVHLDWTNSGREEEQIRPRCESGKLVWPTVEEVLQPIPNTDDDVPEVDGGNSVATREDDKSIVEAHKQRPTALSALVRASTKASAPPPHRKSIAKKKCKNDRVLAWELNGGIRKPKLMSGKSGWQLHLMPYGSKEEQTKDGLVDRFADVCPSNLLDDSDPAHVTKNTYENTYLFDGDDEDKRVFDRSWNWGNDESRTGRWDYLLAGRW